MLLEISIKVLPRPNTEVTQVIAMSQKDALQKMHELNQTPLPLSGLAYENEKLYIRLSGAKSAVTSAQHKISGETLVHAEKFWQQLNEHTHSFFEAAKNKNLWRLSVPYTADINLDEESFIDWAGALYWVASDKEPEVIQQIAFEQGGAATLFKTSSDSSQERFPPLQAKIKQLQINLKIRFDPYGILNYGRLYSDL